MHFGSTLKLLRTEAGLSLRALARRVGVSGAYLSRVENGHDPVPTPDRLTAIAEALELAPDTLVELAQQTGPALASYLRREPAASRFFLEVARRDLDASQLARLVAVMDEEFPAADVAPNNARLRLLIGDRILLRLVCGGIDEVIEAGVARCVQGRPAHVADMARRIREREALSPTVLGNGVAIPHAVVPGAPTAGTLVTLGQPIAHDGADGSPIEIAIVMISGNPGREHLKLLARVARLASLGIASDLREVQTPEQARSVLERIESM